MEVIENSLTEGMTLVYGFSSHAVVLNTINYSRNTILLTGWIFDCNRKYFFNDCETVRE